MGWFKRELWKLFFISKKLLSNEDGWIAAALGALGSLASAYGATEGGKSSSETERKIKPRTSEEEYLWDQFYQGLTGGPDNTFDGAWYLKNYKDDITNWYKEKYPKRADELLGNINFDNPTKNDLDIAWKYFNEHGKKDGHYPNARNMAGEISPSYQQRLEQDYGYQKGLDTDYINMVRDATGKWVTNQGDYLNQYTENLKPLQKPEEYRNPYNNALALSKPISVGIGDFSAPFTTGSQRNAITNMQKGKLINQADKERRASLLDTLLNEQQDFETDKYKLNYTADTLANALMREYTPNKASNEVMDYIQNQINKIDDRRFGVQTSASTNSTQPWATTFAQLMQGLGNMNLSGITNASKDTDLSKNYRVDDQGYLWGVS